MENNTAFVAIPEVEIRLGSLAVARPADMIARASEVATALAQVVKDRKLSRNISGREYVYVEGWATMGAMIGILPREVSVIECENGDFVATVELIRVNDGAIVGQGSAIVGYDEPTWAKRPRYAKHSMSITRATGKAYRLGFSWIMALAGYAPTPAEEMDGITDIEVRRAPGTGDGEQASDAEFRKLTSATEERAAQTPNGKPASQTGVAMISQRQLIQLVELCGKLYRTEPDMQEFRAWLAEQYHGKTSRKELTTIEAAQVIAKLEAAERKLTGK